MLTQLSNIFFYIILNYYLLKKYFEYFVTHSKNN